MRLLVYNWRDIEHPESGGAEVFTHEVLKRLVARGHDVTLFTAAFDGCDAETSIDGVQIVRAGGRYTVYLRGKQYYQRRFRGKFDVIVDEINARPFMTPRYVEEPVVALIHQLAREFWFYETTFPISWLGYHFLEDWWLSRYTDIPTMTVSESTKRDLQDMRFEDVTVVPQGVSVDPVESVPEKTDRPSFLFVGRMTAAKRPDHALESFSAIKRRMPDAKMHMVGDGYKLDDIRSQVNGEVTVHGYVSEARKRELMKRSHILLVPSVREGWGLVVTEANSMGTPAVGYDVPGLRDSIVDGETGLLTEPKPERMAEDAITMLQNGYHTYANAAIEQARNHHWNATTDAVEEQCREVVE